jgi:predicted nucleic acid-binding protein
MHTAIDSAGRVVIPKALREAVGLHGWQWLAQRSGQEPVLVLPADGYDELLNGVVADGIAGGGVYDALVGATVRAAGATLLTFDRRAARTYEAMGVS